VEAGLGVVAVREFWASGCDLDRPENNLDKNGDRGDLVDEEKPVDRRLVLVEEEFEPLAQSAVNLAHPAEPAFVATVRT